MCHSKNGAILVAQMVKILPAVSKNQVQSLGQEDPLEKGMPTAPAFLLENSMNRGAWWVTTHEATVCKESGMTERLTLSLSLKVMICLH